MTRFRLVADADAVQKALAQEESAAGAYDIEDELVSEVITFIKRYVVLTEAQTLVVALWIMHTHCFEAVEQTPYLAITSPVKQCGKSRLLDVISLLSHRPWQTILPSEAVVFRKIEAERPTLLLDEADAIFNPKLADRYEGLRGLLNEGNRRGAKVDRCVGGAFKLVSFSVFCPKAIAGIGTLPDTVADRSIPIRLARKTKGETVDKFLRYQVAPMAEELREKLVAWADEYEDKLQGQHPTMPESLSDRMQEGCELLVAIAEATGCGDIARRALMELFGAERLDDREVLSLRLLNDIRKLFEGSGKSRLSTKDLMERLNEDTEAPWKNYYGRGFEPRDLSALLRQYEIRPTTVNVGGEERAKGYKKEDFHDAWDRYL